MSMCMALNVSGKLKSPKENTALFKRVNAMFRNSHVIKYTSAGNLLSGELSAVLKFVLAVGNLSYCSRFWGSMSLNDPPFSCSKSLSLKFLFILMATDMLLLFGFFFFATVLLAGLPRCWDVEVEVVAGG